MSNFTCHVYQTNSSNHASGKGAFLLEESGGTYKAKVDLVIDGKPVQGSLSGKAVPNQGNLTIVDLGSGDGSLKFTLIRNPYESRLSYGGCAANGGLIYNVTVVAAS